MGDTLVRQQATPSLHRASAEQLEEDRRRNDLRLKGIFESIFDKYTKDFSTTGDEIDLETGQIIVNNGHLAHMRHERDVGSESTRRYSRPTAERLEDRAVRERNFADEESDCDELASGHKKLVGRFPEKRHKTGSTPLRFPQGSGSRTIPDSDGSRESYIQREYSTSRLLSEPSTTRQSATTFTNEILGGVHTIANSIATGARPQHDQPEAINPGAIQALGQNIAIQIAQFLNQHVGATTQNVSNDPWSAPPLPANSGHHFRRPASPPVGPALSRLQSPYPNQSLWAITPDQHRPHSTRPHQSRLSRRPPKRQRQDGSNDVRGLADLSVIEQTSLLEDADGIPDTVPHGTDDDDTVDDNLPYDLARDDDYSVIDAGNDTETARNGSGRGPAFSEKEDAIIRYLKKNRNLSWSEIVERLPGRTKCAVVTRYHRNISHIPAPRIARFTIAELTGEDDQEADHNDGNARADTMRPSERAPENDSPAYQTRRSHKRKRNETSEHQGTDADNVQSSEPCANDNIDRGRPGPRVNNRVEIRIPRGGGRIHQSDSVEDLEMVPISFEAPTEVADTSDAVEGSPLVRSSPPLPAQVNDSAKMSYKAQPQSRVSDIRRSTIRMSPKTPAVQEPPRVRSVRSAGTDSLPTDDEESYDELSTPAPSQHSGIDASSKHSAEVPARRGRENFHMQKWTPEEDALLLELRRNGMRWVDMGPLLNGRSRDSIRHRFHGNPALATATGTPETRVTSKWTAVEDALLLDLVSQGKAWKDICQSFPGRSVEACRNRNMRYLRHAAFPGTTPRKQTRRGPSGKLLMHWLAEEDAALVKLREDGLEFTDIEKIMPGRSATACKTRLQMLKRDPESVAQRRIALITEDVIAESADRMEQLRLNLEKYATEGPEDDAAQSRLEEEPVRRQLDGEAARDQLEDEVVSERYERDAARKRLERAAAWESSDGEAAAERLVGEAAGEQFEGEVARKRHERDAARERIAREVTRKRLESEAEAELEDEATRERRERDAARKRLARAAVRSPIDGEAAEQLEDEAVRERRERDAARQRLARAAERQGREDEAAGRRLEQEATRKTWKELGEDAYRTGEPWTPEEDAALVELVRNKNKTWVELAKSMPGRSAMACRKRCHGQLAQTIFDL